jgi:peroxiredoxin
MLLRDRKSEFDKAGVALYGISRDSTWSHDAWRHVLDLNFPLISDWNAEATHAFGVEHGFRGMRDIPLRTAFLVGRDGIIRGTWKYGGMQVPDVDELLEAARSLS